MANKKNKRKKMRQTQARISANPKQTIVEIRL